MTDLFYVYIAENNIPAYGLFLPAKCKIIGMAGTEEGAKQLLVDINKKENTKTDPKKQT